MVVNVVILLVVGGLCVFGSGMAASSERFFAKLSTSRVNSGYWVGDGWFLVIFEKWLAIASRMSFSDEIILLSALIVEGIFNFFRPEIAFI